MRSKKSGSHLILKPQGRPMWNLKGDISMIQINDEVVDKSKDRLQLKLKDSFSTVIC